jgi:hypothetical protein
MAQLKLYLFPQKHSRCEDLLHDIKDRSHEGVQLIFETFTDTVYI